MTESGDPGIDLGATLRALRRRADLSQRQLAERSGVPASTIGRIEAGAAATAQFRTVERLVAAAGGAIAIRGAAAGGSDPSGTLPGDPHEGLRDEAGRRYPAHLDVRRVVEAKDWWGAWWANWYDLPRHRWPRHAPDHTFDLDRNRRDGRRRKRAGQARVATVRIGRFAQAGTRLPPASPAPRPRSMEVWGWTATDPSTGEVVGWLAGFVRERRVDRHREFVVCDIEVAPAWRRFGLGRRLMESMRVELGPAGVARARVLIDEAGLPHRFFHACGFFMRGPQPTWLMLPAGHPYAC